MQRARRLGDGLKTVSWEGRSRQKRRQQWGGVGWNQEGGSDIGKILCEEAAGARHFHSHPSSLKLLVIFQKYLPEGAHKIAHERSLVC